MATAVQKEETKPTATILGQAEEQLKDQGKIEEGTVKDATVIGGQTFKPDAVDQLGLAILLGFRRKVFALLLLQSLVIWGLASGIARIPALVERDILSMGKAKNDLYMDAGILAVAFVASVATLGMTSYHRRRFPLNMILMSIFTALFSCFLALLGGVNCFYGLALVVGCVVLVGLPACLRCGSRAIEVFPVACLVALLTLPVGFGGWQLLVPEVHAVWVVSVILLNFAGIVWLGYEMDWLCAQLNPDEYLYPLILVWCEVLTIVVLAQAMMMGADGGALCDGGCGNCHTPHYIYCHCDCWIFNDGESSKKQYYRNLESFRAQSTAPGVEMSPPPMCTIEAAAEKAAAQKNPDDNLNLCSV